MEESFKTAIFNIFAKPPAPPYSPQTLRSNPELIQSKSTLKMNLLTSFMFSVRLLFFWLGVLLRRILEPHSPGKDLFIEEFIKSELSSWDNLYIPDYVHDRLATDRRALEILRDKYPQTFDFLFIKRKGKTDSERLNTIRWSFLYKFTKTGSRAFFLCLSRAIL